MPIPLETAVPAAVAAVALVLLVLWRRSAAHARRLRARLRTVGQQAARAAVSSADHGGRLRVVRELHDVAVDRIGAIVAQAEGARYAGGTDPSAAVRAVGAIADTGRATLADLRRVMSLVQEEDAGEDPRPTLRSTRELLQLMRDAGLRIDFEEAGEPYGLDAGADLAVHRILQEAMANALQHGGEGTHVRVGLTWTPGGLAVRVEDDGSRTAVLRRGLTAEEADAELAYGVEEDVRALTRRFTGPGLDRMRTRAELYGGTVTITETPGVGVGITASFPSIRFHNGVHGVDLGAR